MQHTAKDEVGKYYQMILNNINQGVCLHEMIYENGEPVDYRILGVNKAYVRILDITEAKAEGSLASELYGSDQPPFIEVYSRVVQSGQTEQFRTYYEPMDKYFEITVTTPEANKFITLFYDITEEINLQKELEYNMYHDQLTGYYNSFYLEEKAKKINQDPHKIYSIIVADINGLKIINESYNHDKGNQVIIETGKVLESAIRSKDILARLSGDSYALYLPDTDEYEVNFIRNNIESSFDQVDDNKIPTTIALGQATKPNSKKPFFEVLNIAINNMHKNKLLEKNSGKNKILKNTLAMLKTKSQETGEHAIRMTVLAHRLGEKLGLSNKELDNLSLLATLHDIGKTYIPEKILNKPGGLNEEEWQLIKEHPVKGFNIASATEDFSCVAEEILYHHEHWNGNGYPEGLKEKEIPLLSRIISIVDAYDVMISERPYSQPISKEKAIKELQDCAGTQFDPDLVQIFVKIIND